MKSLKIISAIVFFSASAQAETLIYESFNYTPGATPGDSNLSDYTQSGTGLSGNWQDSGSYVTSTGLTFGSLSTAGNKVFMDDDTSWVSTGTTLNGHLDDGDILWFSVLANLPVIGGNADFGFALATDKGNDSNSVPLSTTNGGNGLGFRFKSGLQATAWSGGASSSATGASVSINTTYLIVGKMTFGATDTMELYLPDINLNLGSVVSSQTATLTQTAFNTITFMNKAATTGDLFDEIRFGTSSDDVLIAVPEPSVALMGLVSLGLIMLRRRKN